MMFLYFSVALCDKSAVCSLFLIMFHWNVLLEEIKVSHFSVAEREDKIWNKVGLYLKRLNNNLCIY